MMKKWHVTGRFGHETEVRARSKQGALNRAKTKIMRPEKAKRVN